MARKAGVCYCETPGEEGFQCYGRSGTSGGGETRNGGAGLWAGREEVCGMAVVMERETKEDPRIRKARLRYPAAGFQCSAQPHCTAGRAVQLLIEEQVEKKQKKNSRRKDNRVKNRLEKRK